MHASSQNASSGPSPNAIRFGILMGLSIWLFKALINALKVMMFTKSMPTDEMPTEVMPTEVMPTETRPSDLLNKTSDEESSNMLTTVAVPICAMLFLAGSVYAIRNRLKLTGASNARNQIPVTRNTRLR